MTDNKGLPEERLLRLIKQGKRPVEPAVTMQPADLIIREKHLFPRPRFSYLHLRLFSLLVLMVSLALLLNNLFFAPVFPEVKEKTTLDTSNNETAGWKMPKTAEEYAAVSEKTSFRTGKRSSSEAVPSAAITEMTRDLILMGTSFSDVPQAIVQDKKNGQTYYVSKNQFVGEIKIVDIQENKVIIEYNGDRGELHL